VTAIRVLVVDDSAFTRKVLREVLERAGCEVVGVARDGLDALEKLEQLQPDVVTLDLMMPNLDGLGVLRAVPPKNKARFVIVSVSSADSALVIEAFELGAVDLVHKPTALATQQLFELSSELVAKVRIAAGARAPPPFPSPPPPEPTGARRPAARLTKRVVVLGTSTGGPQALARVLQALPVDLPVPVVIALHIPTGYTAALARRLNESCALSIVEATNGQLLLPGYAVITPGGLHSTIVRDGDQLRVKLDGAPRPSPYTPSVDALFTSAATACGPAVLGVVLTGMGDDGLLGARALRAAGAEVLTEAESSCVVYGMPRCVHEAGLADEEAPLEHMAEAIVRRTMR
jgi:two-component system chemotaxis response regulator CheB